MSSVEKVRNIGIIAHIDAGKTTTTERILYYTRKIHKLGSVDEGTATTDWYSEERRRGISIFSSATTVFWKDYQINIIDTPGHVDFTMEVERALRVLDSVIVIFCGVGGVEAQSETVWRQADRYGVPRIAYINKLDRVGSEYYTVSKEIRKILGANPVAVTIPFGKEASFKGVIDLVTMKAILFVESSMGERMTTIDIPKDHSQQAQTMREQLLESVADQDDQLLDKVLKGVQPETAELISAIRKATIASKIVPVFAGSSLKNKGVQPLLDAVCNFLPSPLDIRSVKGFEPDTDKSLVRYIDKDTSPCALVFKTYTDEHGELAYLKVYTGSIRQGDSLYNPKSNKMERITRIYRMHADHREPLARVQAGDIVAVIGLKYTMTGDTLCDKKNPIVLERMRFPQVVVSMSIEPKHSVDKDKLMQVLNFIRRDDPSFESTFDQETGQLLIHGMGELHLDIVKFRISNDFNVPVNVGNPRVSYKETIANAVCAEDRYTGKMGEKTVFGHIEIEIVPDRSKFTPQLKFSNHVEKDGVVSNFIPAIKDAVLGACQVGNIAGYPIVYIEIVVQRAETAADSNEVAYAIAARNAFKKALANSQSLLLEPYMKLEMYTPEEYLGGTLNDLNKRNVQISDMASHENLRVIRGFAPLSKMFGYATTLRSITQGHGTYTMEPIDYREVDKDEVKRIFEGF